MLKLGSNERLERREKGVLIAEHTRATFQGECPCTGTSTQIQN